MMLLSSNAPIFYYSFLKIERTATGDREIPEANKITVRKHRDYKRSGIEIFIYNCADNGGWELSDYVLESKVLHEKDRAVYFKDEDNRSGMYSFFDGIPELSLSQTGGAECNFYLNYYRNYGTDIFTVSESSVKELLMGISELSTVDRAECDGLPVWATVRSVIWEHYSRIYKWKNSDKSLRDNTDILDKISILGYLEKLCDDRAAKAYASLRQGNTLLFRSFMESAVSCLWTYYVIYGVIGKEF